MFPYQLQTKVGQKMLEDLLDWLEGLVSPVRKDNIARAFKVLYVQQGTVVEDAVTRILMSIKDMDDGEAVLYIERDLLDYLQRAIAIYGVKLNEDILTTSDVDELTEILNALQQADNWEDVANMYAALAYETDSVGTLAEVVSLISGLESSLIVTYLKEVSDSLIVALRDIYDKKMNEIDEETDLLDNEAKLERKGELKARREALFQYIDRISNGNEEHQRVMKTLAGRFSTYAPKELLDKCWATVQKSKMNVQQQANIWCLCLFLMDFYNADNGVVPEQTSYETMKKKLTEYYTDVNFLFTLSIKIDEVLGRG